MPSDSAEDPRLRPRCERLDEIAHLSDARTKANEMLLARAIRQKRVRDSVVTKTGFSKGDWVLIRNESRKKLESK